MDNVKIAKNSMTIVLSSLNDENPDTLDKDSSNFTITLPQYPNFYNYSQCLLQLKALYHAPLIDDHHYQNLDPPPKVIGVELNGVGIQNSYISGAQTDIVGFNRETGRPSTHKDTKDALNLEFDPESAPTTGKAGLRTSNAAPALAAGATWATVNHMVLLDSDNIRGGDNWAKKDIIVIAPATGHVRDEFDVAFALGTADERYAAIKKLQQKYTANGSEVQLAIGVVDSIASFVSDGRTHKKNKILTWHLTSGGKGLTAGSTDPLSADGTTDNSVPTDQVAAVGMYDIRKDKYILEKETYTNLAGFVYLALRDHVGLTLMEGSGGYNMPGNFLDNSVLAGVPFGKRINVRIVDMKHSDEERTANGQPITKFKTIGEVQSEDNGHLHTEHRISTTQPMTVVLRALMLDPEDLR